MAPDTPPFRQRFNRHDLLAFLLLVVTGVATYFALVTPVSLRPDSLTLHAGEVAPQDVQAPQDVEYVSDVRTNLARDSAARAVSPVYTPPDPAVARRQLDRLRTVLSYIANVRADSFGTSDQKRADLLAITDVQFDSDTLDSILNFSDTRWDAVQQDALNVLELVLRSPIRDTNLDSVRRSMPSMVSLTLTEEQANVVTELVRPFIVANSFFSQDLTDAARQQARDAVQPVTQRYVAGELVIQRGQVLSDADIEALQNMGLVHPRDLSLDYLGTIALITIVMGFLGMYFRHRRPNYYNDSRSLILVALLFLVFLWSTRLVIPNRTIIPYIFPLPAFALLIATLFGPDAGLILSIVISILAGYDLSGAFDLTLFYMIVSMTAVLSLGRAHRFASFLWAALVASVAGAAVVTAYRLPGGSLDWVGYLTLIGAATLNGFASASIALLLQYLLAEFLGLTTPLRLLDISRPDAPLLQFFLRNAPGTYQHSLQVANLAEQAAEKLGIDTLLMRVGALYHDVGKALNPSFFIENQMQDSLNPHDDIPPEEAAQSVIRHVLDGVQLARKNRLPRRLQDFMLEHHGTLLARYHYTKAVEATGGDVSKVDSSKFRYPGPRPRSRETALLMLADNVEARARSMRPRNESDIRSLVQKAVDFCQKEGQLAETRLTLKDLTLIMDSFTTTLAGVYHPRIQYPKDTKAASTETPTTPLPHQEEEKQ